MENNKVKYGLKNVYYAVAHINNQDQTAIYDTPVRWPGAVSVSFDAQGEANKFRADNIDYWVGQSNNGYQGDFESALIPESFRKDVLGDIQDEAGVLVEDAGATTQEFALIFQFEGDANATRHVLYNCTATRPSVSGKTTEESIEPQTETLTLTAVAIHNAAIDKDIIKARCNEGDTPYSTWFNSVYQPSTISA